MVGSLLRRRAAAVLSALLLTSLVAGCTDDDADPSSGSSPSATPSEDAADGEDTEETDEAGLTPQDRPTLAPKAPKAPQAKDTPASRRAFTRFVIASWRHALLTNDASSVTDLSGKKSCLGCGRLRAELGVRKDEGWYVELPKVGIDKIELTKLRRPRQWVADARVDIPASTSYFENGVERNRNKARKNVNFQVIMEKQKKRYLLRGYFLD